VIPPPAAALAPALAPSLEERLFRALNVDLGPAADALTVLLSSRAFGVAAGVALTLAVAWRAGAGRRLVAAALPVAVALSDAVGSQVLRPLFGRTRPCYALPAGSFRWVVPAADVGSLPSLHAANFFAMATVAVAADRRLGLPALALAAAVALARVHGGVHWPGDVAAGAAWGVLCGGLSWWAARRLAARAGR
jgi:undecaprenyl-diphosphatase